MAYISSENLCAGMVVARNLLDRNRRVLLQAGVALSKSHIQALRSLGIEGLEIRSSNHHQHLSAPPSSGAAHEPGHTVEEGVVSATQTHKQPNSLDSSAATGKSIFEALRVTRAATKPLQPTVEPLVAQQADTLLNELLKGTAIKEDSAVAAVIKLCTIRHLHKKKKKKTDVNIT